MNLSSSSANEISKLDYKVVFRTTSGAHSAVVAGALLAFLVPVVGAVIIDELRGAIRNAHQRRHEETERFRKLHQLQLSLFGETRNADFIVGPYPPKLRARPDLPPWAPCDVKAAAKMIAGLGGIFSDIADVEDIEIYIDDMDKVAAQELKATLKKKDVSVDPSLEDSVPVDAYRNHVFLGMRTNPFTRWVLGLESEAPVGGLRKERQLLDEKGSQNLPYKYKEKSPEISEERCFWGKKVNGEEEEIYRPIFNSSLVDPIRQKPGVYDQDYLMIIKCPTVFERRPGMEGVDFIVGGCHGCGTEGIGLVLEDVEILSQIKKEIGPSQFFQAIIRVGGGLRPVSRHEGVRKMLAGLLRRPKDHRDRKLDEDPIFEPNSVEFISAKPLYLKGDCLPGE